MDFEFTQPFCLESDPEYTDRLRTMIIESLKRFPELSPNVIKIGLTNTAPASAFPNEYITNPNRLRMSYNPAVELTYNTIGHELTHFVQRIGKYPQGERACDVYTLSRDEMFCDSKPGYLQIPLKIATDWQKYTQMVNKLAAKAIYVREYDARYIKWFENSLVRLSIYGAGAVI